MSLKRKIDKATYDALSDAEKAHYKAAGMDYLLETEGDEDTGALLRAKDRETQEAKAARERADKAEKELKEIKEKIADGALDGPRKAGDIATLEASWKSKVTEAEQNGTKAVERLRETVRKQLVDGTAVQLAAKLTDGRATSVLLPHIRSRIQVDFDSGDEPVARILDAAGKVSALSITDLENEYVANPEFAAIIVGSKATGGGASGGRQSGGGGATKKLAEMNDAERTAYAKADPAGFEKASAELKKGSVSL